ncbi:MAG TPA: hypothetical protein QF484_01225, partial [Candidatus Marinimicrobia bacterium]|nr:hypothetical protein [Candidatus Neomarinimicrobiota bacterium]
DYDENLTKEDLINIVLQVNGKLRANIEIESNAEKESVLDQARKNEKIESYLSGGKLIKEIYVPGRLVNFVVK